MHPSEAALRALLDGELPEAHAQALRAHLEECSVCAEQRAELAGERAQVASLLESLDHVAPVRPDVEVLIARGKGGAQWQRRGALAAGVALLVFAAAAAAFPNSPVRRWLRRAAGGGTGRAHPTAPAPASAAAPSRQTGVALVPGSSIEIVFRERQTAGTIRIAVGDGPQAAVRTVGVDATVAYGVAPGRVVVDNANTVASYEIVIPRAVTRARVRVGDRVVFAKDGAAVSGGAVIDFTQLKGSAP